MRAGREWAGAAMANDLVPEPGDDEEDQAGEELGGVAHPPSAARSTR